MADTDKKFNPLSKNWLMGKFGAEEESESESDDETTD